MGAVTLKIPDTIDTPEYRGGEKVKSRKLAMKRFQRVRANWRVESLPNRGLVWKGTARGSATLDLDMGKYVWVAHFNDKTKMNNFKYREEFLHEVTQEQWDELYHMSPRIAKPMHTTQGLLWHCQFVGCDEQHTSRIAAVLHEAEHQGVDLMSNPEAKADVDNALDDYVEEKAGKEAATPRRGRPRKAAD